MNSNIYLYAHGGSGNHGCEAIVRSTVKALEKENVTLISAAPKEDFYYGIDKICNILKDKVDQINRFDLDFIKAYLSLKIKKDFIPMDKLWYKKTFSKIKQNDIALSIGGDNYCYADVQKYVMLHDMVKAQGAKTVLWGCSVEPVVIKNTQIAEDLAKYDLIVARESISYEALKSVNNNIILIPDFAFALKPKKIEIPKGFAVDNTVGINISPMVMGVENKKGVTFDNYIHLIEYILNETNMSIALIPHVVWKDGDDRIPLRKIYEKFEGSERILMIDDCNCQELKYIISKCRFFVGARTHATIAAYSTGIPTLAVGYSVKARGIARDIFGTEEDYVISVQNMRQATDLLEAFKIIMKNEKMIKQVLNERSKEFIEKTYTIQNYL